MTKPLLLLKISTLALAVSTFLVGDALAGTSLLLKTGTVRLFDETARLKAATQALPLTADSRQNQYFVVQFETAITEADRSSLNAMGLEPLRYLPDDAYIVKGSLRAATLATASLATIRVISKFQPEWAVSPEFAGLANDTPTIIQIDLFKSADTLRAIRDLTDIRGVSIEAILSHTLVVRAAPALLGQLASVQGVEWVQPHLEIRTMVIHIDEILKAGQQPMSAPPTLTGYESGTKIMRFGAAWQLGLRGQGQIASMADTGLDSGNTSTVHADFPRIANGFHFGLGASSWEDLQGHGTHVSGSIVGAGTESGGNFKGGAFEAEFVPSSLWSPLLRNLYFTPDFDQIFGRPYGAGARVHSNSWGSPRNLGAYESNASKVDTFIWEHPELVVLFAAGNSGVDKDRDGRIDEGSVTAPGTAKNIITVGASENLLAEGGIQKKLKELKNENGDQRWGAEPIASDTLSNNPQGLAAFSSRGPTRDGRLKPEVVAPGTNIVSTRSKVAGASALWGAYDDHYAYSGGTSMATPLTAGAAVLVRQNLMQNHSMTAPSSALVKGVLMHSAEDLFPGQYGTGEAQELPTRRPNVHEGYGRVDVRAATRLTGTTLVDEKQGVKMGEPFEQTLTLSTKASLRVTLVYTDAPASASAAKTLVNDLDLEVLAPSGQVFQKQDRINNAEMLELADLPAGTYTVRVTAVNLPTSRDGKLPFALLTTVQTADNDVDNDVDDDVDDAVDNGNDDTDDNGDAADDATNGDADGDSSTQG